MSLQFVKYGRIKTENIAQSLPGFISGKSIGCTVEVYTCQWVKTPC